MTVKIITDSGADLSKELLNQYNIEIIPIRVYDNDTEYLDGVTLDPADLFQGMREGKEYKTSLPSLDTIYDTFETYAKENIPCIYLAFSSGLSGTYQSSLLVKEQVKEQYPEFDIEIVDTKCASVGQGLVVLKAAEMAENNAEKEKILHHVRFWAEHMEHIFTVDDLQYLVRGGRVSRIAGFIGGLLNIKPILHVESGKLMPIEKIRGRKKVLRRMVEIMGERGQDISKQTIGISHGDDQESADALKEMIIETFGCKVFVVNTIGAAIGAHAGPGTLAVFFLNELKN
ncbi:DegV family protein [Microbacteriaceae bacterium 4G12]